MLSNNNPARGHHLRGRWAEIPARLQRGRKNRNFVARLLLGCSPESNPTQPPMKAKTIEIRFIGMRAPPEVTGPRLPIFQKISNTTDVAYLLRY